MDVGFAHKQMLHKLMKSLYFTPIISHGVQVLQAKKLNKL